MYQVIIRLVVRFDLILKRLMRKNEDDFMTFFDVYNLIACMRVLQVARLRSQARDSKILYNKCIQLRSGIGMIIARSSEKGIDFGNPSKTLE